MAEEMVQIVDDRDQVIDIVPRSVMRAKKLCHRVVRVFLFNSKGEIFIHQRTREKDIYPGYFDTSIAGTVTTKTYAEEAARELQEEVGIKKVLIQPLFKFKSTATQSFCMVYKCVYDGKLKLQEEEISWGRFMPLNQVKELIKKEKFHPGGLEAWRIYLKEYILKISTRGKAPASKIKEAGSL